MLHHRLARGPALCGTRTGFKPAQCSLLPLSRSRRQLRAAAQTDPFATSPATAQKPTSSPAPQPQKRKPYELSHAVNKTFIWKGYRCNFLTAGCGEPVVLVHGFGLSGAHYRRMIKELSQSYKVYAIDLLGFGGSAKPPKEYSIELWAEQLADFCKEFCAGAPPILVGNSIGSLIALQAAATAAPGQVRGVVLLNAAGAMNNKGILNDWRILLAYPLLMLIDFLLSIPAVSGAIFKNFAQPDNIRQALKNVYSNAESVDDELVELVHGPSLDAGAREVFVRVITGPPGPKPFGLVAQLPAALPLLVLWGDQDTLTPADGPVGRFFQDLPNKRPATTFKFLPGVGHCLHDDKPELVHAELLPWLERVVKGSGAGAPGDAAACAEGQIKAAKA